MKKTVDKSYCMNYTNCINIDNTVSTVTGKGGTEMIHLDYRDARPIYEQIKDKLRAEIISGEIAPEEKLPSVRELAVKLVINPNTIQRAYRALEAEGFIYSVAGKGSFASANQAANEARIDAIMEQLQSMIIELQSLGVSRQELVNQITRIYQGGEEK